MHSSWFGDGCFLPLVVQIVYAVAACVRAGGYRSYDNYASADMQKHIEEGHPVGPDLRLAIKKTARAVARGQGPTKQAATFNLNAVATFMTDVGDPMAPIILGGPCWPFALMIVGAFFLLRELELAAAKLMGLTVCVSSRRVDWFLPVSKMDARGHGCARSWTCI